MIEDHDERPLLAPTARALGVRPDIDILVDEFGDVEPGEGMSVSPDSLSNLPEHRRPMSAGGSGKDPIWEIESDELPAPLSYRPDDEDPTHGFIEPAWPMGLDDFEEALAETRDFWRKHT